MAITSYNLYTHTCIYSQTTKTKFETPRKGKHTMSMIRYRHTQTLRCKYKNGCRIWRCAVMLPVAMITQLSFLSFSTELMIFHWSLHEKTRKQNCFKKKKMVTPNQPWWFYHSVRNEKRVNFNISYHTRRYTKVVPENAHAVALFNESCFNYVAKLC